MQLTFSDFFLQVTNMYGKHICLEILLKEIRNAIINLVFYFFIYSKMFFT